MAVSCTSRKPSRIIFCLLVAVLRYFSNVARSESFVIMSSVKVKVSMAMVLRIRCVIRSVMVE